MTEYSAASAMAIYGGRFFYPKMYGDIIVVGDSITDPGYGSKLYSGQFAHLGSPYRLVANAGVTHNTLDNLWARWATDVLGQNPKIVWLRIGTNTVDANIQAFITSYKRFTDSCQANNLFLVVCALPPKGSTGGAIVKQTNIALDALCKTYTNGMVRFFDDCIPLAIDAEYNYNPAYYSDAGTHPNGVGQYLVGAYTGLIGTDLFLPNDPRVSDSNDRYYVNTSSDQYVKNPFMQGSSGTKNSFTGTVPDFWSANCAGVGAAGVASILPADVGDANQTPWFCCDLVTAGTGPGASVSVDTLLSHPAFAADMTTKRFDIVCEMKLINFDSSVITSLKYGVWRQGVYAGSVESMAFGGGILNDTFTLRCSYARNHRNSTVVAYPTNTMLLDVRFGTSAATSGLSGGKFAIRLASVRGQLT